MITGIWFRPRDPSEAWLDDGFYRLRARAIMRDDGTNDEMRTSDNEGRRDSLTTSEHQHHRARQYDDPADAALEYAGRGWPVFPMSIEKRPLSRHGLRDATCDPAVISAWWRRWPRALPAIATGELSGVVGLDVDQHDPKANGFDTLETMGVASHLAVTPTAHTPSGGCHLLFRWPGHFVKSSVGEIGAGLDVRGDRGSLILPPGPGRCWDLYLGLDTQLAPMPAWMVPAAGRSSSPEKTRSAPTRATSFELSAYAEGALDDAVAKIKGAGIGEQRSTLNRESFSIGALVASGVIPADLALAALELAAAKVETLDPRRPWRSGEVAQIVKDAYLAGQRHPRGVPSR
jgi:bifunctional DNA primase/polymerase-like protein